MKYIKKFEKLESSEITPELKQEIIEYMEKEFPSEWFDQELSQRASDYISDDDVIGYGTEEEPDYESPEDAYCNLCNGGAIEYDLMHEIEEDVKEKFHINDVSLLYDIVNDYLMDHCEWYDRFVFHKSTEGYKSISDRIFGSTDLELPS
jgi:hypothetical protein